MQKEYYGLRSLRTIIDECHAGNVFVVTGKESFTASGAKNAVERFLKGLRTIRFCDFSPNPSVEDVKHGLTVFRGAEWNMVVAIGGGSVIDMAKMINILSVNDVDRPETAIRYNRIERKGLPLVAISTTAGTGSEATHFSTVFMDNEKFSLTHEYMLPDYVVLDHRLTLNLPPYETACTGMDALAQSVESFWSVNSTEESRSYAREAIKLILPNIVRAVNTPNNESREAMYRAAHLSGKAINISKTTLCHALAYPLTIHFHIPHGHAAILTLAAVFRFNWHCGPLDCQDKRTVRHVKAMMEELLDLFGVKSPEEFESLMTELLDRVHLKKRLSESSVSPETLIPVIGRGLNERAKNNPRKVPKELAEKIISQLT